MATRQPMLQKVKIADYAGEKMRTPSPPPSAPLSSPLSIFPSPCTPHSSYSYLNQPPSRRPGPLLGEAARRGGAKRPGGGGMEEDPSPPGLHAAAQAVPQDLPSKRQGPGQGARPRGRVEGRAAEEEAERCVQGGVGIGRMGGESPGVLERLDRSFRQAVPLKRRSLAVLSNKLGFFFKLNMNFNLQRSKRRRRRRRGRRRQRQRTARTSRWRTGQRRGKRDSRNSSRRSSRRGKGSRGNRKRGGREARRGSRWRRRLGRSELPLLCKLQCNEPLRLPVVKYYFTVTFKRSQRIFPK
jgi:hypothetical protein